MSEQIYKANVAKLTSPDCHIKKSGNKYHLIICGEKFKLSSKWISELQLNAYNEHFDPTWLLDPPAAAKAMVLRLQSKLK